MRGQGRVLLLVATVLLRMESASTQSPRLGGAVNIFSRYGYLSISMRVVPRNDTENWIFREPTLDVFKNPVPAPPRNQDKNAVLKGDFHMEFCDNIRQLLQAYFRDFTFERLDRPWRAFTASWSRAAIAKHLGINASFATGDHCYVLVRVARFRETQRLDGPVDSLILDEAIAREVENVTVGDYSSVIKFVRNFGSHYVSSYVTGNSLYQVCTILTDFKRSQMISNSFFQMQSDFESLQSHIIYYLTGCLNSPIILDSPSQKKRNLSRNSIF